MTIRRFQSRNALRFYLIVAIATCFCLGSTSHAAERIRIAMANPNMPNLTAQIALKRGFFKDEDLDAEIIRMNPNIAVTALATGDIDYCQHFSAVVGGAVSGLPVRKDIKILALGSDAARMTALTQRIVDVVVMSPPADTQLDKQGYKILARAYELFKFPYLGLGTHLRKINEKPQEIRRALKATVRANRFIRDNRDESARTLIAWGKVEREFAYASYDALRVLFNNDGAVVEDGLKLVIEQARRHAKITREVALNEVVDFTFLREAQAKLGIKAR